MGFVDSVYRDVKSLALAQGQEKVTPASLARLLGYDGVAVLAMTRAREAARRWHVPLVNRALRLTQMAIYNIEIAKEAEIGEGVYFLHTIGVIIGGSSKIGARTLILGSVTIGNLNNRGYPTIGEDVVIGAGARILGPVHIGDGALIGANAVVVTDVPAGATAIGVPAVVRARSEAPHAPKNEAT